MTRRDGHIPLRRMPVTRTPGRCRLRALMAVAILAPALALFGPADASSAQTTPSSEDQAPDNVATPEVRSPAPGEIVHSWSLTPSGDDPAHPGNRSDLSYDVAPGTIIEDNVILFNYSNVPLTFRVYATDAINNPDGSFNALTGDEKPKDVGSWVSVPQENITLLPGKQATMPIVMKVPATARPGDHVGVVLASSEALGSGQDNKIVNLDRRTGTRLYVRVAGPLEPELVVTRLKATYQPGLNPLGGSAKVTYRIENRGNVRLEGTQRVSIAAPFGLAKKTKSAAKFDQILPGEWIELHESFEGVTASGLAIAKVDLDIKPIAKDVGAVPARSSRSFTAAIPFTVLVFALAVWLVRRAWRSYRRHGDDKVNDDKVNLGVAGNA